MTTPTSPRDQIPIVFLDRPPHGIEADCVLLDNLGGARTAVEHLLARGHERIAVIADPDSLYTAHERLTGYRLALEAAGVPVREELIRLGSHDSTQAEAVVHELLALPPDRRPTALFAGNNRNTVGALRALRQAERPARARRVRRLRARRSARHHRGPARQRQHGHARRRAGLRAPRASADHEPRRVVVPTELIVRGSGEVPP